MFRIPNKANSRFKQLGFPLFGGRPFRAIDLFANGEYGFLNTLGLDTLFTDTSGTTPVSAYGDAIALAVNLAPDGPDMVQATGAERLVYGRMPVVRVRNLANGGSSDRPSNTFSGGYGVGFSITQEDGYEKWARVNAGSGLEGRALPLSGAVGDRFVVSFEARYDPDNPESRLDFNSSNATIEGLSNQTITADWKRYHRVATLTSTSGVFRVYSAGSLAGEAWHMRNVQVEKVAAGVSTPSDYQDVIMTNVEITQPGIPSVNIAYADPSDDNWSWDLPAGTYHLFIAGEKGCLFAESTHAGGEFSIGPTTWPDGPAGGIQTYIGQRYVIVPVILDRAFSDFEKAQLVAYAVARGCPGEVTP